MRLMLLQRRCNCRLRDFCKGSQCRLPVFGASCLARALSFSSSSPCTWHMPCTIPCLCLFSSICFFLQKSLLLYFCILKFPFLLRPSTNTGLPVKLFQILACQHGLPLWTVLPRIASCRCLSFAVNTQTHKDIQTQTYMHTHRYSRHPPPAKYKHIEGRDCILLFGSFQHTENALDSEATQYN